MELIARKLKTAFWLGEIVYLRVRAERSAGMITTVYLYSNGYSYGVTWGETAGETCHQEMELTSEFVPDFGTRGESD